MINKLIAQSASLVDDHIAILLPKSDDKLSQAMRYSALSKGKRLRPFIVLEIANIFNIPKIYALRVAAAIEITHSYSLIHDDLPAMDDDDFRRGMPSCHKKFGEACAILAGDALLTLAFEILAEEKTHHNANIRCELIKILAKSIGSEGMAGGQMIDLIYEQEINANYEQLVHMQYMKTAKLFMACAEMAVVLSEAQNSEKQALLEFAKNFGLAFQFFDDIDDIDKKEALANNNIAKLIGKDETTKISNKFIETACISLDFINKDTKILKELAQNIHLF